MRVISLICIFYMTELKNYIHTWVRTLKTVVRMCSCCTHAGKCLHLHKYPLIIGTLVCTVCDSVSLSCQNWAGNYVLEQLLMLAWVLVARVSISCNFLLYNIPLQCLVFHGDLASSIQQIGTRSLVCVMREQTRWLRKFASSIKQTCDVWRVFCLWSAW